MAAENKQNCIDFITNNYSVDNLDDFWVFIEADNLPAGYDLCVLDCAVMHGVDTAMTLKKPIGKHIETSIAAYTMDRLDYYEQSGGKDREVFDRINKIQVEAFNQANIKFNTAPKLKNTK